MLYVMLKGMIPFWYDCVCILFQDIATRILSFSQQRPRALCILSASGTVSAVTLRQPTSSSGTVTYEVETPNLSLSVCFFPASPPSFPTISWYFQNKL